MSNRDIANVKLSPWMSFVSYSGGRYYFKVRICKFVELKNYPLIEAGALWINLNEDVHFSIQDVMMSCPATIASGSSFPYQDLTGQWQAPEDLKFDRATAPIIISAGAYVEGGPFGWGVPVFLESSLEYIPSAQAFTEIPESMENMWKQGGSSSGGGAGGEWAAFMPDYDQYVYEERRVATRHPTYNYTQFTWWGQFIYDGCDLSSGHILLNYDTNFPISIDPNSLAVGLFSINSCHSEIYGVPILPGSGGGVTYIDVGVYISGIECTYFPGRDATPQPFYPSMIHIGSGIPVSDSMPSSSGALQSLGAWRPRFSRNRELPIIFEPLTAGGEPLTAEGEPLEARK